MALEYLKQAYILEDSIMLPFLAILKDHLEEFQVFLGNVESWLMESTANTNFLQNTFSYRLDCRVIGEKCVLKTLHPSNDNSQYDLSFDISISKSRGKFTKFLAYVTDF